MSIFGWSYPPGCSGPPEQPEVCECCGQGIGNCFCPECPDCGTSGDPHCYVEHSLTWMNWQMEAQAIAEILQKKWAQEEERYIRECVDDFGDPRRGKPEWLFP